jgi:hypothetical protein
MTPANFSPRWANRKRSGPAGKHTNASGTRYSKRVCVDLLLRSWSVRICFVLGGLVWLAAVSALQGLETWYRLSILNEPVELPAQLTKNDMYTVSILSQKKRWRVLERILKHYSTCPKVQSISVVWDGSPVPYSVGKYPVSVSFKNSFKRDSLNNRFSPDVNVSTEAVLSVDDDLLVSCNDVLRAFAEWKASGKHQLVGFLPRLVVRGDSSMEDNGNQIHEIKNNKNKAEMLYLAEKIAIQHNKYNVILTPLMVYNSKYMALYWSDEYKKEREFVDSISNCEDLLMNYIVSYYFMAHGKKGSHAKFVQPRRRLDISRFSSCGVSCGTLHLDKRQKCAGYFEESFQSRWIHSRTRESDSSNISGWNGLISSKFSFTGRWPVCWIPGLGCIYW